MGIIELLIVFASASILLPYSINFFRKKTNNKMIGKISASYLPTPKNIGNIIVAQRNSSSKANDTFSYNKNVKKEAENNLRNMNINKAGVYVAGVEATALYGSDIFHSYFAVDDHVYEGIERLSNMQFDNLADLSSKVETYQHDFWSGLSEKGVDKLGGHIGEVYAAEHFEKADIEVNWPDASNQEGWDLLLNGHDVNVKLVADVESLSKHFAEYPDIPVVIPSDAANIPSDALHLNAEDGVDQLLDALSSGKENLIIVDDLLSHSDIMEQTADATDFLVGSADIVDAHIPFITALFSGWREAKLLKNSKTDFTSAAKNIGLDVAGAGIGSLAGAKGGAMIGAIFGPVGVGVGAVLGGITGAFGGRAFSNKVKTSKYKDAILSANNSQENLKKKIKKESRSIFEEFGVYKKNKQMELEKEANQYKNEISKKIETTREWRLGKESIKRKEALNYINDAIKEIHSIKNSIIEKLNNYPFYRKFLLPNIDIWALSNSARICDDIILEFTNYKQSISESTFIDRGKLLSKIGSYGLVAEKIERDIVEIEQARLVFEKQNRAFIEKKTEKNNKNTI